VCEEHPTTFDLLSTGRYTVINQIRDMCRGLTILKLILKWTGSHCRDAEIGLM